MQLHTPSHPVLRDVIYDCPLTKCEKYKLVFRLHQSSIFWLQELSTEEVRDEVGVHAQGDDLGVGCKQRPNQLQNPLPDFINTQCGCGLS